MWEIVNDHLETICGTKGVPALCCVCDAVFPKYHRFDPALDYIIMIIACYAGMCDDATPNDIHVHGRTAM